jgi:hypothetical protein
MECKKEQQVRKYELEQILEMLGGEKYYSREQIMYVYHATNGDEEEALHYKALCAEQVRKECEKYSTLKTEEEIQAIKDEKQ